MLARAATRTNKQGENDKIFVCQQLLAISDSHLSLSSPATFLCHSFYKNGGIILESLLEIVQCSILNAVFILISNCYGTL